MSFTADSIKDDNICVIWVDDMIDVFSWRDSFGVRIETPKIDRLMARGVRFSNAYAVSKRPKAWLLPDNCAAKQSSNCEERRISRKRPQLLSDPSIWMQPVARWLQ